jgi:hypothetical protein
MGFEVVSSSGRGSGSTEPKISLRKSGSIGLNRPTIEEWFEDVEYVRIHYDEENNLIGFEPTDDEDNTYTLSKVNGTGSITPMSFLNQYQLTPDITTHFAPTEKSVNQHKQLVVIDLDNPIGTYGQPAEEEDTDNTTEEKDDETSEE